MFCFFITIDACPDSQNIAMAPFAPPARNGDFNKVNPSAAVVAARKFLLRSQSEGPPYDASLRPSRNEVSGRIIPARTMDISVHGTERHFNHSKDTRAISTRLVMGKESIAKPTSINSRHMKSVPRKRIRKPWRSRGGAFGFNPVRGFQISAPIIPTKASPVLDSLDNRTHNTSQAPIAKSKPRGIGESCLLDSQLRANGGGHNVNIGLSLLQDQVEQEETRHRFPKGVKPQAGALFRALKEVLDRLGLRNKRHA